MKEKRKVGRPFSNRPLKQITTISIDSVLLEELKDYAYLHKTSKSSIIEKALRKFLSEEQ